MRGFMVVFILQVAVSIALVSEYVSASDGDVDYTAPYITVDPATGQLVTRNPGPHLKSHPQDMSAPAETKTANTDVTAVANQPAADGSGKLSVPAKQLTGTVSIITIIVAGMIVGGVLLVRRKRQQRHE